MKTIVWVLMWCMAIGVHGTTITGLHRVRLPRLATHKSDTPQACKPAVRFHPPPRSKLQWWKPCQITASVVAGVCCATQWATTNAKTVPGLPQSAAVKGRFVVPMCTGLQVGNYHDPMHTCLYSCHVSPLHTVSA